MIIYTSICANYLPRAVVLVRSIKKYNPRARVVLLLIERAIQEEWVPYVDEFDDVVLAKEIGIPSFESYIFKYDIVEASTAVKGQFFKYLLEKYPEESKFVYLDPDIRVYHSLDELDMLLDEHQIILTPHVTIPEQPSDFHAIGQNEVSSLTHGIFNLGFLAISRGTESQRFINWWSNRLFLFCYDDMKEQGLFTDQKWIDLAPAFFNVFILKKPGYNVAHWNISNRTLTKSIENNNVTLFNNEPLVFYHFSAFGSDLNKSKLIRYVPDKENVIYIIMREYKEELERTGGIAMGQIAWSYGFYQSGEKINKRARQIYRQNMHIQNAFKVPYESSNKDLEYPLPVSAKGRYVFIWGTGSSGVKAQEYYQNNYVEVHGFIDNAVTNIGKEIEGKKVWGFDNSKFTKEKVFIIIGSSYVNEITAQLVETGYMEEIDFIVSPTLINKPVLISSKL